MNRRALLGCVSAAVVAGTAGCLDGQSGQPQAHLADLWFLNESDDTVPVEAAVENSDGETVYEVTFDLGGSGNESSPPSNTTRDPSVDEPGGYVVRTTVGDETAAVDTTEHVDGEAACVLPKFVRSRTGTLHARPYTYTDC